jgi:hypothetical protein
MPHERFRSVTRLPEMLAVAVADDRLDPQLRARAELLLKRYPEEAFRRLIETKQQGLPSDFADCLDDAISWLQDLRTSDQLSDDLMQRRRWILRHFPEPWDVRSQRKAVEEPNSTLWSSIDHWIKPERD